jgi:hypothetical protein
MFRIINNNFKIIIEYKSFLNELDNLLDNVPRKDLYFKDYIRNVSLELLELILTVNNIESTFKLKDFKDKIKAKIAILDFLLERLYTKKYICEASLIKVTTRLVQINKMTSIWISRSIENASKN